MDFVANFIRFPAVQKFENRLRFDEVTESLKVGTFLRHSVDQCYFSFDIHFSFSFYKFFYQSFLFLYYLVID